MNDTNDKVLDNGMRMSEILPRWEKLVEVARLLDPKLGKQCDYGILDPETDLDALKVKIIALVTGV